MLPDVPLPVSGSNNFWYLDRQTQFVIVFVHGIFSDSRNCWLYVNKKNPSQNKYWPALIASDLRLGDASIYMDGYYTTIDAGPYEIRNCADEMFRAMSRVDEHGRSPVMTKQHILFVCHSTGGIVARYLLEYYVEQFRSKSIGLLLIASPSYGAKLADKLSLLSRFYNQRLGIQLRWGNWSLRDLDARVKDLVNNRTIQSFIGIEAYENRFIFHRKWLPDRSVVVTEESAGRYFGAPVLLRGTDHFSCVKPPDINHPAHELLVDFWYKYKQVSPPDPVRPLDQEGRGNTRTSPLTEIAAEIGAIKGVDYTNGVRLLYSLSDIFVGYSQQPPSKSYEDYQSAEAQVKDWIFSNKLNADPKVIEMMENFIKKIRSFVSLGNKLRELFGGDGRPKEEMLREWDQELTDLINQTASRIRLLR